MLRDGAPFGAHPLASFARPRDGDEGIRTPDLLRAREALSQLSYIPVRLNP
jgi:hypothetical protein